MCLLKYILIYFIYLICNVVANDSFYGNLEYNYAKNEPKKIDNGCENCKCNLDKFMEIIPRFTSFHYKRSKRNVPQDQHNLLQNGRSNCKLNPNSDECQKCSHDFYFNTTTLTCERCNSCYGHINEKITEINDQFLNLSYTINYRLSQHTNTTLDYTFRLKVKTLENNICNLFGIFHKQPRIIQTVKLQHLDSIIDLIDKSVKEIMLYLNGHINYTYLEKVIKNLEEMITALENEMQEWSAKKTAEKLTIRKELNNLKEESNQSKKEEKILMEIVNTLMKESSEFKSHSNITLIQVRQKQIEEFKHLLEMHKDKFVDFNKLVMKAQHKRMEAVRNKDKALDIKVRAEKLILPKKLESHLRPNYDEELENFIKDITHVKGKMDSINDINKLINDYDKTKELIETILSNKTISKCYDEITTTIKDLQADMDLLDTNILELNTTIDKKRKAIETVLSDYEKQKELAAKHRKDLQKLEETNNHAMKLKSLIMKLKVEREKLRKDIDNMNDFLNKRKLLIALIDDAIEIINELKIDVMRYEDIIALMQEQTDYLELIPVDDFQEIEILLTQYENYFDDTIRLKQEKLDLESEVNNMEILVNSLVDICPNKWHVED